METSVKSFLQLSSMGGRHLNYPDFVPKIREIRSKIADFFAGGLREYRDQAASIAIASGARGDGGLP
jgi:hypothetical protein